MSVSENKKTLVKCTKMFLKFIIQSNITLNKRFDSTCLNTCYLYTYVIKTKCIHLNNSISLSKAQQMKFINRK